MARTFSAGRAALWSLTWSVGAGLGVALGAYLTVVGAQAAPGDAKLDLTELLLLPLAAAALVFAVSFLGRLVLSFRARPIPEPTGKGEPDGEDRGHHEVTR